MPSTPGEQEERRSSDRPPLFLSLETAIKCPNRRCGKVAHINSELVAMKCAHCGWHWWATQLAAGDIRSQIRSQFDGNELFVELLDILGAPERIDEPMYWQIPVSGHERYRLTDRSKLGALLEQSHELIRKLVERYRR